MNIEPVTRSLEYASPRRAVDSSKLRRWAVYCALAPMAIGLGIFLLWLATRWFVLMLAGYFTILGGVLCVLAGGAFLLGYARAELREGRRERKLILRDCGRVLLLLLANLPLAFVVAASASHLVGQNSITIVNAGSQTIDQLVLSAPGVQQPLGQLAPRGKVRARFRVSREGEVWLKATAGGVATDHLIDGYNSGSVGVEYSVTLNGSAASVQIH